ncbi:MAG: type I-E CRISPR-associated protein Cas5/CasD [Candidatus Riflebacteria bacterium]|nr:type I-E CRISPR-associated protein Cas5/CasD [Candidatus Riflebacteria bacterium]
MFDILLLRFDAPLMSFGGQIVDNFGKIQEYPALSLMAGLLGNALGFDHREAEKLNSLQERLRYAVRRDRPGVHITDYQRVDLGQSSLSATSWTTRGFMDERGSGEATSGTHIRYREYIADAVYTIALRVENSMISPTLLDLEKGLKSPTRPLFLGRKSCLPAAPIFLARIQANSLIEALVQIPIPFRFGFDQGQKTATIWFSEGEDFRGESELLPVTDERDWYNQIHVGRRMIRRGVINIEEVKKS